MNPKWVLLKWKKPESKTISFLWHSGKIIGTEDRSKLPEAGDGEELTTRHEAILGVLELLILTMVMIIWLPMTVKTLRIVHWKEEILLLYVNYTSMTQLLKKAENILKWKYSETSSWFWKWNTKALKYKEQHIFKVLSRMKRWHQFPCLKVYKCGKQHIL